MVRGRWGFSRAALELDRLVTTSAAWRWRALGWLRAQRAEKFRLRAQRAEKNWLRNAARLFFCFRAQRKDLLVSRAAAKRKRFRAQRKENSDFARSAKKI